MAINPFKLPKNYHPDFAFPASKPTGPVEIDWDNPITKGLKTLMVAPLGRDKDLVDPSTPFVTTSPAFFTDQSGQGLKFNGSSTYIRNTKTVPSDYPFTFFASFSNAGSVFGGIVGLGGSGSGFHRTAVTATGTDQLQMRAQTSSGNASEINVTYDGSAPVTHIVAVYNSATDRKFFINGALVGTATSSVPGNVFNRFTMGAWDDASQGQYYGGVIYQAGHFQRVFSDGEARSLSTNPFQILTSPTPPESSTPVAAAVGLPIPVAMFNYRRRR